LIGMSKNPALTRRRNKTSGELLQGGSVLPPEKGAEKWRRIATLSQWKRSEDDRKLPREKEKKMNKPQIYSEEILPGGKEG